VKEELEAGSAVKVESGRSEPGRKRSREPKSLRRKTQASAQRACRRDCAGNGSAKFELITSSVMSAAVRKML